jgi:hypothetical protein
VDVGQPGELHARTLPAGLTDETLQPGAGRGHADCVRRPWRALVVPISILAAALLVGSFAAWQGLRSHDASGGAAPAVDVRASVERTQAFLGSLSPDELTLRFCMPAFESFGHYDRRQPPRALSLALCDVRLGEYGAAAEAADLAVQLSHESPSGRSVARRGVARVVRRYSLHQLAQTRTGVQVPAPDSLLERYPDAGGFGPAAGGSELPSPL